MLTARYQLLAACLAGCLLAGCGKEASKPDAAKTEAKDDKKDDKGGEPKKEGEPAEATPQVEVAAAEEGPIRKLVIADAVLFPLNQANVTPKITSPVKKVMVNRGDHVRAGQVVAELEDTDLQAAVAEARGQNEQAQAGYQNVSGATVFEDRTRAQADVNSAKQALDAATRVYENRVNLAKEGALAQKLVDDAKVVMVLAQSQFETAQRHLQSVQQVSEKQTLAASKASAAAAKAHYDTAVANLSYAKIVSPISGVVADRPIYPGEMPPSGMPIVSIVDISSVVARANVPVKDAGAIHLGSPATITGPAGELEGKVTVVSPSVDANSTTVQVWVQAANKGEMMKPGGTVRVAITAQTVKKATVVPKAALLNSDEGGEKVLVVVDGAVQERKVEVGIREPEKVQILKGVKAGEQVITAGGLGIEDKAKVEVKKSEEGHDDDKDKKDDKAKDEKK